MGSTDLVAIGRSRYLYDGINHLLARGYSFKAIVTDDAYEEYDIKLADFERLATECGAAFFAIKSVNNEELATIIATNNIRVAISVNWRYTIPKAFLDLFECGILNFHLGNLPDYKGNATVNWAIINGERYINANVHKMDPDLDAGDVIVRKAIPIASDTYIADILRQAESDVPRLYEVAIAKVLAQPDACEVKGTVRGSRCYPRLPEDSHIEWNQPAESVCRLIRASSHPYTGAFTFLNDEKIIIWKARVVMPQDRFFAMPGHVVAVNRVDHTVSVACADGLLEVQEVERSSGEVMAPTEFMKSVRLRFR